MNSPFRTWSLRSRLTLGIVLLTAIGFFSASIATQSLLKSYLISEVDKQLSVITTGTFEKMMMIATNMDVRVQLQNLLVDHLLVFRHQLRSLSLMHKAMLSAV